MRNKSPANKAASSPPVPARISSIAEQQRQRERALGGGEDFAILAQFLIRHLAQFVIGIVSHVLQRTRLGAQPPHFARGLRDGLELGILF